MVKWVIKVLEECALGDKKEFYASIWDENRSYIAQGCSNVYGRFMALVEYESGGRRSFLFITEEMEGRGWKKLAGILQEVRDNVEVRGNVEEGYGGGNLTLAPMVEAHHGNNHSYKKVLKQLTVLAPAQNRGGGGFMELSTKEVSSTMTAQRTAGPSTPQLNGGVGVKYDGKLAEGDVCHTF